MEELIRLAESLGKSISEHDRFRALRTCEQAVQAKPELRQLLQDYESVVTVIQEKEMRLQPIEPAEKRKAADLKQRIAAESQLLDLARRQADYAELMHHVNDAIRRGLGIPAES